MINLSFKKNFFFLLSFLLYLSFATHFTQYYHLKNDSKIKSGGAFTSMSSVAILNNAVFNINSASSVRFIIQKCNIHFGNNFTQSTRFNVVIFLDAHCFLFLFIYSIITSWLNPYIYLQGGAIRSTGINSNMTVKDSFFYNNQGTVRSSFISLSCFLVRMICFIKSWISSYLKINICIYYSEEELLSWIVLLQLSIMLFSIIMERIWYG